MAVLAQLVEHRIVIPSVTGSIPVHRPKQDPRKSKACGGFRFLASGFRRLTEPLFGYRASERLVSNRAGMGFCS